MRKILWFLMDRYDRKVESNASMAEKLVDRESEVVKLRIDVDQWEAWRAEVRTLLGCVEGEYEPTVKDRIEELQRRATVKTDEVEAGSVSLDTWLAMRDERDAVQAKLDDALERGIAVAKQHADLRLAAGCVEGQSLERRIDELMRGHFVQISERMRKERDEARAEVEELQACLKPGLDRGYRDTAGMVGDLDAGRTAWEQAVQERDEALERHKQAHDRAMALHVVIDHAVDELRKVHSEQSASANRIFAHNAINILVNDERVKEAAAEVEVLQANAANWEAEALERSQNQTNLENRMDEAAKLLREADDDEALKRAWVKVRQALAILARGEGG